MPLKIKKKTKSIKAKPSKSIKAKTKKKTKLSKKSNIFEPSKTAEHSPAHGPRRRIPWPNSKWPKKGFDLMPPEHGSTTMLMSTKSGDLTHELSVTKSCGNCSNYDCEDKKRNPNSSMSCIVGMGLNSWSNGKVAVMRGWWKPLKKSLKKIVPKDHIQAQIDIELGKLAHHTLDDDEPKKRKRRKGSSDAVKRKTAPSRTLKRATKKKKPKLRMRR